MPAFLTISVGESPTSAHPVLASSDQQAVLAALREIYDRVGGTALLGARAPLRVGIDDLEE